MNIKTNEACKTAKNAFGKFAEPIKVRNFLVPLYVHKTNGIADVYK
jgi:hypothetical protein